MDWRILLIQESLNIHRYSSWTSQCFNCFSYNDLSDHIIKSSCPQSCFQIRIYSKTVLLSEIAVTLINSFSASGTAVIVGSIQTAHILLRRSQSQLMCLISLSSVQSVKSINASHTHCKVILLQNMFRYPFMRYSIHLFYFVLTVLPVLFWYLHFIIYFSLICFQK